MKDCMLMWNEEKWLKEKKNRKGDGWMDRCVGVSVLIFFNSCFFVCVCVYFADPFTFCEWTKKWITAC